MNKRFLFRYFDIEIQEYIKENLSDEQKNNKNIIIEQSTGLRDHNQKLLYEGDIIQDITGDGSYYKVYFDEDNSCFKARSKYGGVDCNLNKDWILHTKIIVGNIHKNNNLIEY